MDQWEQARQAQDVRWRKVQAPAVWRPGEGEELIGRYAGTTMRDGQHGTFPVVAVRVPRDRTYHISGSQLHQLVQSAGIDVGDLVRVVFAGWRALDNKRTMKLFELYVSDAEYSERVLEMD